MKFLIKLSYNFIFYNKLRNMDSLQNSKPRETPDRRCFLANKKEWYHTFLNVQWAAFYFLGLNINKIDPYKINFVVNSLIISI